MNHRVWAWGVLVLATAGCAHQQARLQSEDDPDRTKEAAVKIIGDVTAVGNLQPMHLSGVGLVVDLEGTGGGAPTGSWRSMLEEQMQKRGIENVKELLNSRNTSMVLVSAVVPPGARKGDPIDVQVVLPPQSKTTSLRNGYLTETRLFDYGASKDVAPGTNKGDFMLKGHVQAKAEGPLVVGFGDGDDASRLKQARIWGGARCVEDRPLYLVLNNDQQYARVAMNVAERINATFQSQFPGAPGGDLAIAKTKSVVYLQVPPQYRHNLPRYLRVVKFIPMQENPGNSPYRRRLQEDLLDPKKTVTAALRLEALGPDSIPLLQRGLEKVRRVDKQAQDVKEEPYPVLVRFAAAEALAYLGSSTSGDELSTLAEQQPAVRAYCLTALASLNEAICDVKLGQMLGSPSTETRYGAFRALRAIDERDPKVKGDLLNESFWLHRAAPDSAPLVHLSTTRRAEIVLFGEDISLIPPFPIVAGPEFTVTAGPDDERCTISRISVRRGTDKKQCSLKLEDVLRTMARMGATYSDVIELLIKAERLQCLSAPVAKDALPQAVTVYELARAGQGDANLMHTDLETLTGKEGFGPTPTLFETTAGERTTPSRTTRDDEEKLLRDPKKANDKNTAGRGTRPK